MANKKSKKVIAQEQEQLKAFLAEIDEVQKKHALRLAAVLEYTKVGVYPRFEVQIAPADEVKVDTETAQ